MTATTRRRLLAILAAGLVGTAGCGSQDKEVDTVNTTTKDLVVTRVFDTPVERVWGAWTECEQVKRWWGPHGFTAPVATMDVRVGGTSLVAMRSPEGRDHYTAWTYRDIVPLNRLEFVLSFTDQDGNKRDPVTLGLPPGTPQDVRHVVTVRAVGPGTTEMTVTEFGYTSDQVLEGSRAGLEQSLDKMAASFRATNS